MIETSLTSTDWPKNAIPKSWIDGLFEEMLFTFGKRFSDMWQNCDPDAMKNHWESRLSGLTNDELKRGYAAMQKLEWPPSLPEFMNLCRPPVDPTAAYYEAIAGLDSRRKGEKGTWRHPAVFHAARKMAHDLLNQTYSSIRSRWERALSEELSKGEWEPVTEPEKTIGYRPGVNRKAVEAAVNEIRPALEKKQDRLGWARKILENPKRYKASISRKFAEEAIGKTEAA